MSSCSLRTLIGFGGALIMLLPAPVDAQIVRRFAGGGVQVRAPFVRVNVGPYGRTSVRAPFVAVDPGGVRVGLRQRLAPLPQQAAPLRQAPVVASGDLSDRGYSARNAAAQGYVPFPTAEDLLAMDDPTLFTALSELFYSLDARLSQLTTGAGWQRHLLVPGNVLRDPTANLDQLEQGLIRFDSVADNPDFAKIAGLPSFIATKAALRQVVVRLAKPQAKVHAKPEAGPDFPASAEEVLPTPTPVAKPEATRGEHSILKQAAEK